MKIQAFFPCASYQGSRHVTWDQEHPLISIKLESVGLGTFEFLSFPQPLYFVAVAMIRKEDKAEQGKHEAIVTIIDAKTKLPISEHKLKFELLEDVPAAFASGRVSTELEGPGEFVLELTIPGTSEKSIWPFSVKLNSAAR